MHIFFYTVIYVNQRGSFSFYDKDQETDLRNYLINCDSGFESRFEDSQFEMWVQKKRNLLKSST